MTLLGDTAGWGLIVGIVLPWLTAVVQQPQWTGRTRRIVAVGCAAAAGFLTCAAAGTLTGGTLLQTTAAVLVASQAAYARLLGPSAKAIETATAWRPGPRERLLVSDGGELEVEPAGRHARPD